MHPGLLTLAPPLTLLALTIGLILAAYARLIMEGFTLIPARRAIP
jgi:hypothetical protein